MEYLFALAGGLSLGVAQFAHKLGNGFETAVSAKPVINLDDVKFDDDKFSEQVVMTGKYDSYCNEIKTQFGTVTLLNKKWHNSKNAVVNEVFCGQLIKDQMHTDKIKPNLLFKQNAWVPYKNVSPNMAQTLCKKAMPKLRNKKGLYTLAGITCFSLAVMTNNDKRKANN
jgi:hypothetical protein